LLPYTTVLFSVGRSPDITHEYTYLSCFVRGLVTRLERRVPIATVVGFFVPIFWGVAGFILFNAKQSVWTDVFWWAVYVTCPFWVLPGRAGLLLMPFLNAGMYGLITAATLRFRQKVVT
jgi:hypothetical protein